MGFGEQWAVVAWVFLGFCSDGFVFVCVFLRFLDLFLCVCVCVDFCLCLFRWVSRFLRFDGGCVFVWIFVCVCSDGFLCLFRYVCVCVGLCVCGDGFE